MLNNLLLNVQYHISAQGSTKCSSLGIISTTPRPPCKKILPRYWFRPTLVTLVTHVPVGRLVDSSDIWQRSLPSRDLVQAPLAFGTAVPFPWLLAAPVQPSPSLAVFALTILSSPRVYTSASIRREPEARGQTPRQSAKYCRRNATPRLRARARLSTRRFSRAFIIIYF